MHHGNFESEKFDESNGRQNLRHYGLSLIFVAISLAYSHQKINPLSLHEQVIGTYSMRSNLGGSAEFLKASVQTSAVSNVCCWCIGLIFSTP